jgi:hypothetical protein
MDKDIKISLYDIFGFLLPGFILFIGLSLVIGCFIDCGAPIAVRSRGVQFWLALAVLSYFFGHFSQALGNVYTDFKPFRVDKKDAFSELPMPFQDRIRTVLQDKYGVDCSKEFDSRLIYLLVDESVLQLGNSTEREIFQYREGFYRGLAVSLLVLTVALGIRWFFAPMHLLWHDKDVQLSRALIAFLALIAGASSLLMHKRYMRFASIRVRHAFGAFLVIHGKKSKDEKNNAAESGAVD